jgi:hypothetical protein
MRVGQLWKKAATPVIAPILKHRVECLCLTCAAAVQIGLVSLGLPGWPCPIKAFLGIPCPGCGLSTAISQLLHGQWQASLHTHAFAPLFLAGVLLVLVVSLLPENSRQSAIRLIEEVERHTSIVMFLLVGLLLYWGLRLL